ncbi:MAG: M23 family metallopeptidase [Treponema sp.]|jgi:murein DD-endopeptidase MepM/ murein hydrolase activator NlpD|nr:M23 family metallopeptidase [Treponema sp.]
MSSIAITQHVKRRVKAKNPPPSFHQVVNHDYSKRLFKRSLKSRRLKPAEKKPCSGRPSPRSGSAGKGKTPLSIRRFLFGGEGLFPLPAFGPDRETGTGVNEASSGTAGTARFGTKNRRVSGFPLSPFIAAILTIIISVAAINWKMPAIISITAENNLGAAGRGEEAGRNMAFYAGVDQSAQRSIPAEGEIPLDLVETFSWKDYKIKKGDTLSEIAKAQGLDMGTLIASNGITNARRLREGEVLRIPNMDGIPYTVKAGDSLSGISTASSVPLQVILDVNDLESDVINAGMNLFLPGARMPQEDIRLALGEAFVYPVRGVLSSPYGWRVDPIANVERFHSAIDLAAPLGTPVKAAMDGKVSRIAVNSVYGNYIIITHPGAYQTMYAHLSAVSVKQGASVTRNSKIGEVGSTGYSTGPHLHFAVFRNDKPINPLEVLQR